MHYCKTCQWAIPTDWDNDIYCNLLGSSGGEPDHHGAGAYASDYESYRASFRITNPNTFGCLCHSDLKPELLI